MTRLAEFIRARAAETYPEPSSPGHDQITAQILPEVCKGLPKGFSVLDVGCGQGVAFPHFMAAGTGAVTGITTNDTDLKAAAKWCHENDPGCFCCVSKCDMHDIVDTFPPEKFDLIWARHVLEHSIAPPFVLWEFFQALKPGGLLYCEFPEPDTSCFHESNQNHYAVFGERAWQHLLLKADFEIKQAYKWELQTGAGPDVYFGFLCRKPER